MRGVFIKQPPKPLADLFLTLQVPLSKSHFFRRVMRQHLLKVSACMTSGTHIRPSLRHTHRNPNGLGCHYAMLTESQLPEKIKRAVV